MMALRACSVLRKNNYVGQTLLIDFTKILPLTRCLHGPPKTNEYSDVPLYPPIPQFKNKKEKGIAETKSRMEKLGTVEEKQYFLNKPKYYGWYSYLLSHDWIPQDCKPFLQFATQTHIVEDLPEYYKSTNPEIEKILDQISPNIEKIILNHHLHSQREYEVETDKVPLREVGARSWTAAEHLLEAKRSQTLVRNIHQVLMTHLMSEAEHLHNCSEDMSTRNEAFWFRGGMNPDKNMLLKRLGTQKKDKELRERGWMYPQTVDGLKKVMTDEEVRAPYERCLQYLGSNMIQLRADQPLPALVDRDTDPLVTQTKVAPVPFDPRMWGFKARTRHGTNVPGVWPDVDNQHGLLFYMERMNRYTHQSTATQGVFDGEQTQRDMMASKAMLASWGWLSAQATHLGFSPLTELTYPLVTQGTITDGQTWTFTAYQLNTVDLTTNTPENVTCNNVMWMNNKDVKLYDEVDEATGKIVNFRPEVLAPLVKMYLREPKMRDYSLTPYLSDDKTVANFPEAYQRKKLHETHRHMYSNRPGHKKKPEIYLWEKLHLVDHPGMNALKLGARRKRWFQMYKIHHWGREVWHPEFTEYEEKSMPYLPKAYRKEDFMKKKGLGRRYNKHLPKLTVPLEETAAVYKLPKTKYEKPDF